MKIEVYRLRNEKKKKDVRKTNSGKENKANAGVDERGNREVVKSEQWTIKDA